MPDSMKMFYDRHKDKRTRPSPDEILEVLHSVTAYYSKTFIIVDASDKCQANNSCRARFLSELFHLHAKCGVNLFVNSRFNCDIIERFDRTVSLDVRACDGDMLRYIEGQISSLLRSRISEHLDLQSIIR